MASSNNIRTVIQRQQARKPAYYSPRAISERLDVHIVTVYKWMAGENPSTQNLARLARDLGVPMEALLEWVPDPEPIGV